MNLAELIAAWEHEAALAEQLRRVDGYAALCRETVKALRELELRRTPVSLESLALDAERVQRAGFEHCPDCGAFLRDRSGAVGRHLFDCPTKDAR